MPYAIAALAANAASFRSEVAGDPEIWKCSQPVAISKRTPSSNWKLRLCNADMGVQLWTCLRSRIVKDGRAGLENHQRGRWFINVGRFIWIRRRHAGREGR
jgi:hypothetical protein